VISLTIVAGATALAVAARPLARWRGRRIAADAARRASFHELLDQAAAERLKRQAEAEGDQLPWR
jgi:hypothetical protein